MKKLFSAVAIALGILGAAHGQTTTFYDAAGRVTGKARINVDDSTTYYDAAGRVTGKASAQGRRSARCAERRFAEPAGALASRQG